MHLVWFRNDLRTSDNSALYYACLKGPVTGIYFVTPEQWKSHQLAPIQADFIEQNLTVLAEQLAALGIPLLIEEVADFSQIPARLKQIQKAHHIEAIHANEEPEINEKERDQAVKKVGLPLVLYQCDCILQAGSVLTKQGGMYKVFTAFRNAWMKEVKQIDLTPLPKPAAQGPALNVSGTKNISVHYDKKSSQAWPAGETAALQRLRHFLLQDVEDYHHNRDIPSLDGTSGLSAYLKFGVISAKRCVYEVLAVFPYALDAQDSGVFSWVNEIVWREFYRHLMIFNPQLCKGENFNKLADNIIWSNNREDFKAWCEGRTGYGLVDAAMRQLNDTGWMHNRLRMVTASFLSKHLLIDWRWGEAYFREHLIDGDLASNNGGWQWAASTGCDAQPYFRIFNPIIQSQKFDPKGLFIRKYVKELNGLDNKTIHFPVNAIVEHKQARLNALDRYSVLKKG
ncbi:deoxyribodipyrimidine photo-lyase [Psychromonas sp. MB-3u-54]|uniref:deoxyribodipyrimidine photo-lyase n=1 Tax=Psychromonas sp. MB-3u-54 TaxID=2058319 RepID=UPI000C341B36|nr:deoxyribodipyrimidine photo-lyase [Psychromonas sp. MB-3u-54]PKH02917.1 deoxyribodipyrimidine photo-lyase [Psychromonas sp. MB-3u-54]